MRGNRRRRRDAMAREDRLRLLARGRVGHGRARGDHRRIVAGHVGDRQGHDARRMRRRGQPPALELRKMLAHAIHLVDRGAGFQQRRRHRLHVGEGDAVAGQGQTAPSRRPRSGTAPDRPACGRRRAPACATPRRGRPRRAPDAPPRRSRSMRRHGVAVAGHHQAFDRSHSDPRPRAPSPRRPCRRRARSCGLSAWTAGARARAAWDRRRRWRCRTGGAGRRGLSIKLGLPDLQEAGR